MSATPRILLIDDDEPMLALVEQLAKKEFPDARVETVAKAKGLARALEAGDFNLVITDYQLGWTDGLAVLRSIKARYPDCPVIMFTATGSEEIAVEAMKAGLDDYVLKSPKHVGLLMTTVRSVLEQAELKRKLKGAEDRYRALVNDVLDTSAVGLFILDAGFRVVWVNSALERYFGLRRADVLGQDKRRLIQERIKHLFDDPEGFAGKVLQTYEQNDHGARFECHVLAGEGREERWLEHRSLPILAGLYAGGRIEHYYDITELHKTAAALRKSEGRLAAIIDSAMDAIIMVDGEHRILMFNAAAEVMFRCAAEEAIGQFLDRFIPERFRAAHREHVRRFGETGQTNRVMGRLGEVYGLRSDGTEFPLEVSLSKGATGTQVFYTAILRDITERKRAEEALRESNDRLTALIQASPLAITILDADGRVKLWSPAAERIFGWTQEEVLNRPLPTVPPERQDEHRALRARVLRNDSFTGMEVIGWKKGGDPINISLSTAALRDAAGHTIGILGLIADITQRKQIEQQAARMERLAALGQLLGGIAHELKNPLFILNGHMQLLQEKLAHQEFTALPAELQKVEAAANRMTRITERFLALAKPYHPRQERCSVGAILQQTITFLANEMLKSQITVKTALTAGLPSILSDPMQLQEVFLNLMLNALQAMTAAHGKGTLTVSAALVTDAETRRQGDAVREAEHDDAEQGRQSETEITASPLRPLPASPLEGNWIEVKIQDNGPGIPPEHLSQIFEPFFTTKSPEQGTGLGLWIVRNTMMALNGTVACETEIGRGATFIVRLPVSEESRQQSAN